MRLKIKDIIIGSSRRSVEDAKVRELADSIREVGLLNPISVTKEKRLIAGAHRLEAAKLNGETEIEATLVEGDDLHLELAEIDENLIRNELDPISIGELAIRRDEILEAFGQRANKSNKGKSTGEIVSPLKTTESRMRRRWTAR